MKWFKRLAMTLVAIVVVLVVGVTAFVMTFNPNDYRSKIEQIVQARTGRQLTIDGKMHLSIFPRLGLRLSRVSLSNPKGFAAKTPFASIHQLELGVALLPLFSHKLVVDQVVVDGLELDLVRHADGRANWQGLAGAAPTGKSGVTPGKKAPPAAAMVAGAPFALAVAGVDIHRARVVYDDQQAGRKVVLAPLDLSVGHLSQGHSAPLTLDFHMEDSKPSLGLDGHLTARLGVNIQAARYQLEGLDLKLSAKGDAVPKGLIAARIQGALVVDLAHGGSIRFKPFSVSVNNSHLKGSIAVTTLANPHITFALALDQLNVDQYFPPPATAAANSQKQQSSSAASTSWSTRTLPIPLAALRRLNMDGKLSVGQLTVRKLKLSQIHLAVSAHHGLIRVTPVGASLYGGTLMADATVDARGRTPQIAVQGGLKGVQVGDLLKDYAGDRYLTGQTQAHMALHTQGLSQKALVNALDGKLSFAVRNGSIQHSHLASQVQSVLSKLQALRKGTPAGPPGAETRFASLTGSARVSQGVIDNQDLLLNAIQFAATGRGTVNLPRKTVDYALRFTGANGKGMAIPLLIRGPLRHPGYEIDLKSMAQGVLQQQLNQQKQKAGNQLKQRLEKALPGLKGLFR